MKLYHGSKNSNITLLKRRQAQAKDGVEVPEDELKEGVYLTPDYGFVLAMAARPDGLTNINDEEKNIKFEDPKLFKPEERVYVYEVEVEESFARQIDGLQYLIEDLDDIEVGVKHEHLAKEIEDFYKIENIIPEIKKQSLNLSNCKLFIQKSSEAAPVYEQNFYEKISLTLNKLSDIFL